jgi:hypothetical protein
MPHKIKNQRLRNFSFSRSHLLIFAVIFAAIGGYILLRSFAATTPSVSVSLSQNGFPTGDQVTIRGLDQLSDANIAPGSQTATAVSKPYINSVALVINWQDLEPTSTGGPDKTKIQFLINQVAKAASNGGRTNVPPIILEFAPGYAPDWSLASTRPASAAPVKTINQLGWPVLAYQTRKDIFVNADHLISTDPNYQVKVRQLEQTLSDGMEAYDPQAVKIPAMYVIGPAMESNVMRVPDGKFYSNSQDPTQSGVTDDYGFGWTARAHHDIWKQFMTDMNKYPAFNKRFWIFPMTDQPGPVAADMYIASNTASQLTVANAAASVAPQGPAQLIVTDGNVMSQNGHIVTQVNGNKTCSWAQWRDTFNNSTWYPSNYVASSPYHGHNVVRFGARPCASIGDNGAVDDTHDILAQNLLYGAPSFSSANLQRSMFASFWAPDVANTANDSWLTDLNANLQKNSSSLSPLVFGTKTLSANIDAGTPIIGVQFKVDSVNLGAEDTSAPFQANWTTNAAPAGLHKITAIGRDASGNLYQAPEVDVNVAANQPPPPVVNFSASPTSALVGSNATLTWNSTNATSCTASGDWSGAKGLSGSISTGTLSVAKIYIYNLSCSGNGGTAGASESVKVTAAAPSVNISASPTSINSGSSATLTWNSSNTSACTASGDWSGVKTTSGSASTGSLTTARTYTYTLSCTGAGGAASGTASVAVAAVSNTTGSVSIAAAGDIACETTYGGYNGGNGSTGTCQQKWTSNLVYNMLNTNQIQGVLTLGDHQYNENTLAEYNAVYGLTWGRFKYADYPAIGNHEIITETQATDLLPKAHDYCAFYNTDGKNHAHCKVDSAGVLSARNAGYYSFNLGSWHIISLNTDCETVRVTGKSNGCNTTSAPEYQWLQQDLAANQTKCTLAYAHHPFVGSGAHAASSDAVRMNGFYKLLYDYNADVFLAGHDHVYERIKPVAPRPTIGPSDLTVPKADAARGLRNFTVGTGGKTITGFSGNATATAVKASLTEVRNSTTYGVLKLTLNPTSYSWQFVRAVPGVAGVNNGTFSDSGSGNCH